MKHFSRILLTTAMICAGFHGWAGIAFFAPDKTREEIADKIETCVGENVAKVDEITPEILANYSVLILWGTRITPSNAYLKNHLDEKGADAVRSWVENGGGLLCLHDAVGLDKHDSKPLFPDACAGINNYYPDRKAYSREVIVSRSHPITHGIPAGSRFVVSYFDFITLKLGNKGTAVARRVSRSPVGGIVGAPLVATAQIGRGRYAAFGLATGYHATNSPVDPVGMERRILVNTLNWLAKADTPPAPSNTNEFQKEIVEKGEILGERNLVDNPSCEIIENNFPVGWGVAANPAYFDFGATDREKHSGRHSIFLKAKQYQTRDDGTRFVKGGVATSPMGNGLAACVVNPDTEYEFSFWMKTDVPYVRISTFQWITENKWTYKPTTLDKLEPVDDQWREYSGKFTTAPDSRTMALEFRINGRSRDWGRNPAVPLGSSMYIDDVVIHESGPVRSLSEQREKCFVRMSDVEWKDAAGDVPKLMEIPPETPLDLNQAYLEFPGFSDLPRGGRRIDLDGLWRIKKFYGVEESEIDGPGMDEGYWRGDFKAENWARRHVPSCWYSKDTPEDSKNALALRREVSAMDKQYPFPWLGWYRRTLHLPDMKPNERAVLHFQRVSLQCSVWLNGINVGEHAGGRTPFSFDVTKAARGGAENVLAVRVFDPIKTYDWRHWAAGGIWGTVHLDLVPEILARRVLITPNRAKSELEVEAWLVNPGDDGRTTDMEAVVQPYPTPLSSVPPGRARPAEQIASLGPITLEPGLNKRRFIIPLNDPIPWSCDNPFLYTLELKVEDQFVSRDRFGFRSFVAKGPDFLLNGKPLFLRGECFNIYHHYFRPGLIDPDNPEFVFMKKMLLAKRGLKINNIYSMITPLPPSLLNLLDELGLLLYGEWHAAQAAYPQNEPVKSEEDVREMEAWVYEAYNHPCQAIWSLGGELYEHYHPDFVKSYDELLNPLYHMIKKLDKQGRPVCQSSGRLPQIDSETDVWDDHAYPGCIIGAWTQEDVIIAENVEKMRNLYGKKRIPLIQYEVGGFVRRYNSDRQICDKAGFKVDNDWDKEAFIRIAQAPPTFRYGLRQTTGVYGLRRWLRDLNIHGRYGVGSQKLMIGRVLSMARCNGMLAGIGPNADAFAFVEALDPGAHLVEQRSFFRGHYTRGDLSKKRFVASEGYEDFKRAYNPALICWLLYPKNSFAGKRLAATTYLVNDTGETLENLSVRIVLKTEDGTIVNDTRTDVSDVPHYKRLTVPYETVLPADLKTGAYKAELFLYENEKVIADNHHPFFVLGNDVWNPKVTTEKKVAVVDAGAKIFGSGQPTTALILKELGIPFTRVDSFETLDQYDVLIIGAYSSGPALFQAGDRINAWLRNGGRLLRFEQMLAGPIPYLPHFQMIKGLPNICGDIITLSHPAFRHLTQQNFFRWKGDAPGINNCPGAIFTCGIKPMDTTMVAVGATGVMRSSLRALSMLLADVRVGEGVAILNQMEATCRFGDDAAASMYIKNLVEHALSDTTSYSTSIGGFTVGQLNHYECGLVNVGSGKRHVVKKIPFMIPDKPVTIQEKQSVSFDLTDNVFYDPDYEAKYDAEYVDEGGLSHERMETIYLLYRGDALESGKTAAMLTFRFAGGGARKLALTSGVHFPEKDSTGSPPKALRTADGLFLTTWENPSPELPLKSLDVTTVDAEEFELKGVTGKLIRERTHR